MITPCSTPQKSALPTTKLNDVDGPPIITAMSPLPVTGALTTVGDEGVDAEL